MWNAKLYDTFSKERIQPSIDLANRIDKLCVRILDVGCGSGMSTLALRNRFPEAEIVGVDLSADMLENAKKLLPDVKWIQMLFCNGSPIRKILLKIYASA